MFKRGYVVLLLISASACGDGNSTPSAPSTTQVAGVWTGTLTQTSASGLFEGLDSNQGECLALFQLSTGRSDRFTASIEQTGITLAATATSQATGQSCSYSGTAENNTIALTINASTATEINCSPSRYQVMCDGASRDVYLISRSIAGTVSGNTISGKSGETWRVLVNGKEENGAVVVNNSFTLSR